MTPKKLYQFRERLRRVLKSAFPEADAVSIGRAMTYLERLMVNEAFRLTEIEHPRDCACWHCILSFNGEVVRWQAQRRAAAENEDYD